MTILGWVAFGVSIVYLIALWPTDLTEVLDTVSQVGILNIIGAIFAYILSLSFQAGYHALLLERISNVGSERFNTFRAFALAQVVRYLPGKIWGVIFQSHRQMSTHSLGHVMIANFFQSAMTVFLTASLAPLLIVAIVWSPAWWLACTVPIVIVEIIHRRPRIERTLLELANRAFPRIGLNPSIFIRPISWHASGMLVAEWLFFLLSFVILLSSLSGWQSAMVTGAWYACASIVAIIAVVVPAGIAVREAVFLSIPSLVVVEGSHALAIAALIRLIQLVAEVVLALLAAVSRGPNGRS